eukprot:1142205-Pelagomonas_calceolata.AAC.3
MGVFAATPSPFANPSCTQAHSVDQVGHPSHPTPKLPSPQSQPIQPAAFRHWGLEVLATLRGTESMHWGLDLLALSKGKAQAYADFLQACVLVSERVAQTCEAMQLDYADGHAFLKSCTCSELASSLESCNKWAPSTSFDFL